MKIAELWRYAVKTMAGEQLSSAALGPLVIEADRIVHLEDADRRFITSRTHPRFLSFKSKLGDHGVSLVDAEPWHSAAVAAKVVEIAGH